MIMLVDDNTGVSLLVQHCMEEVWQWWKSSSSCSSVDRHTSNDLRQLLMVEVSTGEYEC